MKHPVKDRVVILLCALLSLCAAIAAVALCAGKLPFEPLIRAIERAAVLDVKARVALAVLAVLFVLIAVLLVAVVLPGKRRRSSSFAIQKNENGTVRISLKALDALVQKCLNQHAELKVVTSSLFSDEESIRVDVHITLQSDISMPLAISALQKQIKKYLEACSGVMVQEVRVFVDNTTPANEDTVRSPYAIPASLLGVETTEALPGAREESDPEPTVSELAAEEEPAQAEEPAPLATDDEAREDASLEEDEETTDEAETGDWA